MRQCTAFFVLIIFVLSYVFSSCGFAQGLSAVGSMPLPGAMVALTPAFTPAHLRGMVIHPNDPFQFDFIVYRGDEQMTAEQKLAKATAFDRHEISSAFEAVSRARRWAMKVRLLVSGGVPAAGHRPVHVDRPQRPAQRA